MGELNAPLARRMTFFAKLTSGLVFFSVLLMASILVISAITLVRVNQIERKEEQAKKLDENPLNIPSPVTVNPEDHAKYKAYSNFANRLRNSMDFSKNPCDNFYEYSCGNFKGNMSFEEIQFKNLMVVINQFKNEDYMKEEKLPFPVKQAGQLFAKCVEAKKDWDKEVGNGKWLEDKMTKLEDLLKVHFPLLHQNSEVHYPNAATFSAVVAYLNNEENLPTFLTTTIETNWHLCILEDGRENGLEGK